MRYIVARSILAASLCTQASDPEFAPTPYTAQQIREATPVGRTYEFLVERPDAPPARRRMVFVAVTPERATTEIRMFDTSGKALGEPERSESTWEELRNHARYPKADTMIERVTVTTPAGSFPCQRYTVQRTADGKPARTVACFAYKLPGPPVELRREIDGRTVMTMTLQRYEPGGVR